VHYRVSGHEAAAERGEASTIFGSVEAPDGGGDAGARSLGVDRGPAPRCEQEPTVPMAAPAVAEGGGGNRRYGASRNRRGWRSAAAAGSRRRHRDHLWLWGTGAPARRGQLGDAATGDRAAAMNGLPAGTVWLAAGTTDMRKGFDSLAAQA